MRKCTLLLVILVMVLAASGCSRSWNFPEGTTEAGGGTKAAASGGIKAGFLFVSGEEGTDVLSHKAGMSKAQAVTGLAAGQVVYKTNVNKNDVEKKVDELVESGCNVIFSCNAVFEDSILECARKYPDVTFCQMDGRKAEESGLDNMHNYYTRIYEAYYVGGMVAGKKLVHMLNTGKASPYGPNVGFVASKKSPEAISCANAFYMGVKREYSNATMYIRYVNSSGVYDNDAKQAKQLVAAGVSIMGEYTSTSAVASICAENGIPMVGRDVNLINAAPKNALTSATSDWSVYYTYVIQCLQDGKEIEKDWIGGYAEGANIISQLNDKYIVDGTAKEVAKLEKNIRDHKARIFNLEKFTVQGQNFKDLAENNDEYKRFKDAIGDGQYRESYKHSAPDLDVLFDGVEVSDYNYLASQEEENN